MEFLYHALQDYGDKDHQRSRVKLAAALEERAAHPAALAVAIDKARSISASL